MFNYGGIVKVNENAKAAYCRGKFGAVSGMITIETQEYNENIHNRICF